MKINCDIFKMCNINSKVTNKIVYMHRILVSKPTVEISRSSTNNNNRNSATQTKKKKDETNTKHIIYMCICMYLYIHISNQTNYKRSKYKNPKSELVSQMNKDCLNICCRQKMKLK